MIKIQYGSAVKDVQIPYNLTVAGFEDSLQNVFSIKGKSLYGFRYPMENMIIDLSSENDKKLLIHQLKSSQLPFIPVFHSIICCINNIP